MALLVIDSGQAPTPGRTVGGIDSGSTPSPGQAQAPIDSGSIPSPGGKIVAGSFGSPLVANPLNIVSPTFVPAASTALPSAFFVDPQNSTGLANDANAGTSAAAPFLTMAALVQALYLSTDRDTITINVLSDLTNANDPLQIYAFVKPFGAPLPDDDRPIAILVQGQRKASSFVDPNTGSTSALTLTSNALAPNTASAPNGLPAILTVAGFDFSPYIGQFVQILSSSKAAAVNTIAVINQAPSLGTAYCTPLYNFQIQTLPATTNPLAKTNYPPSGSTFRIYTTTNWAPHVSPGVVEGGVVQYQDITFLPAASGPTSVQNLYTQTNFLGCTLQRPVKPSAPAGAPGTLMLLTACSTQFAAQSAGKSPIQIPFTGGEARYTGCGFVNVDLRIRERNASVLLTDCVLTGSLLSIGTRNDAERTGQIGSLTTNTGLGSGVGFFNWPGPGQTAPGSTSLATTGAAIDIGHGAIVGLGGPIYGNCSTVGTFGVRVASGAKLVVRDGLSSSNPPPAGTILGLTLTGNGDTLFGTGNTQIVLDDEATQLPETTFRGVIGGGIAPGGGNYIALGTWAQWDTAAATFNRNAFSWKSGAAIVNGMATL